MPRPLQSRAALPLAALGLALLALAPRPAIDWARWLKNPSDVVFGPIRGPATGLFAWLRRDRADTPGGPEYVRSLEAQIDQYRLSYLQARTEVDSLREVIRAIAETQKLNTSRVRLTVSAVIGAGPDLSGGMYTIQAGQRDGVLKGDVVVAGGVNVLGRIARVDQRTSAVLPTFAQTAGKIDGVVMLTDDTLGPRCQLEPDKSAAGRLYGRLWDAADPTGTGAPAQVKEGMLVRLDDANWPRSSRMLVLGRVERVGAAAAGRQYVTVVPLVGVTGAGEVMVRTEVFGDDAAPTTPAGSTPPAATPPPTPPPTKPAANPAPSRGGRR